MVQFGMRRAGRIRFIAIIGIASLLILPIAIYNWVLPGNPEADAYTQALFAPEATTLAPRIHMLGRMRPSVAYAIETSRGLVLVDAGLEADASVLKQQLQELKLDASQLRVVLLTHAHGDHTRGARNLRETTGATIYAGKGDSDVLQAGVSRDAFFSTFPMDAYAIHATPVDVELSGGEVIDMGDTQIEALATPGHTPGSTCYLLQRGDLRVLFTGDTICNLVAELGTYSAYLAPRYRGNARDYLQTLLRLRAMPTPNLVLPGHPLENARPHSPRMTDAQWHALLDGGISAMKELLARYERDGEDFLDGNSKDLLPGLHYLGDYTGHAVYVLNTGKGLYLFDAPGDAGFVRFFQDGLKKARIESQPLTAVLLTSCDGEAMGGLASLVKETACQVVVPDDGWADVKAVCKDHAIGTSFVSPGDLPSKEWFPVQVLPLAGRGLGPTAYWFSWHDKRVLVSGQIPAKLSHRSLAQHAAAFELSANRSAYARSLRVLSQLDPQLWLPSHPLDGQNANLYEDDWPQVLQANSSLVGN